MRMRIAAGFLLVLLVAGVVGAAWGQLTDQAIVLVLFFYLVFDQTLNMAWPETLLGTWWPELKVIPSL